MTATPVPPRGRRRPLLLFVPLLVFLALAGLFVRFLRPGYNAADLPSALVGRPVPGFELPAVAGLGVPGLAARDLAAGKVSVVNVFASWCVPCHQEHATLMRLAVEGVPLVGIAYKDEAENTRRFLNQDGNPYAAVGADAAGRTGIDFGVYGVPETYVVRGDGVVAAKLVGPMDANAVRTALMPAIARARQDGSRTGPGGVRP